MEVHRSEKHRKQKMQTKSALFHKLMQFLGSRLPIASILLYRGGHFTLK